MKKRKNKKIKWAALKEKKLWILPLPVVIITAMVIFGGIGAVAALSGWFGGNTPEDTLTRGLVGSWNFDEGTGLTAHDSSNYANNGVLAINGPQYRKSHTISPSTGAGTKYQVGIKVYYGSGTDGTESVYGTTMGKVYLDSHCQTNFDDVSFRDNDGVTNIHYWLDEKIDSDYAIFWVEVADSLESEPVTIYIYYGDSAASSAASASSTFAFSDDFELGNLSRWTSSVNWDTQDETVKAGTYAASSTVITSNLYTNRVITYGYSFEWWMQPDVNNQYFYSYLGFATNRAANVYFVDDGYIKYYNDTGYHNIVAYAPDTWYRFKITAVNSTSWNIYVYSTAGALLGSATGVGYRTDYNTDQVWYFYLSNQLVVLDNVFIRKFVSSEPSHGSWGTEEFIGPSWTSGKSGSALQFDGVGDYVNVGSDSSLDNLSSITVEAWVKADQYSGKSLNYLLSKYSAAGWNLVINGTNSVCSSVDGVILIFSESNTVCGTTVLSIGEWYHVAFSVEGSKATLYLNGKQEGSGSFAHGDDSTYNLTIGSVSDLVYFFDGLIDEVRIYNRALSAEEIRYHYNGGGPVAYWKLDEGSGLTAYDSSGDNDGTLLKTLDLQVAASSDDCYRMTTLNYWNLASVTQISGQYYGGGMRFTGITIPQGAQVERAYLTFTVDSDLAAPDIHTQISAEDVDDAPTFADNGPAFDARWANRTTATVYWDDIEAWAVDTEHTSPEIKTVIQEVVDRASWANGNDIVIFWEDFDGRTPGLSSPFRRAYSYDGSAAKAPVLHIEYSDGPAWVAGKYGTALSFDGVDDYVDISSAAINAIPSSSYTTSMWFKVSSQTQSSTLFSFGQGISTKETDCYIHYPSGNIYCNRIEGTINIGLSDTTKNYVDGAWHYFTVAYNDSAKSYTLSVDGIQKDTKSNGSFVAASVNQAWIGELYYGSPLYSMNGLIDDVRIYSYARTEEQIRLDYNAGLSAKFGDSSASCQQDPGSCTTQGLLGYWSFDEGNGSTTYDASDFANNGSFYWISTNTNAWTQGKVGGAFNFDGVDDYVNAGSHSSLDYLSSGMTVEGWINADQYSQQLVNYPIAKHTGTAGWAVGLMGSYAGACSGTDGVTYVSFDANTVCGSTVLSVGAWYHVAFTYNGSLVTLYLNGVKENSGTMSLGDDSAANLNIGRRSDEFWYFDGLIDEVRVYNRALSAEEINYNYNRGGPMSYWKFDEGSGSTAFDSIDNNNDGTLYYMSTSTNGGWIGGKYNTALSFDGVDDYLEMANPTNFNSSVATISAWVKMNGDKTGANALFCIGDKDTSGQNEQCLVLGSMDSFWADETIGTWRVVGGTWKYILATRESRGVNPFDNKWHLISATYDGVEVRIYLDGAPQVLEKDTGYGSNDGSFGGLSSVDNATIGVLGRPDNWGYFNGVIDDFRFYNYARTGEQIRLDYNAGFSAKFGDSAASCQQDPGSCITQGLVGYWNFEEGSGVTASYGTNGTLEYNFNGSGVSNGALRSRSWTITGATMVTLIETYHYNGGAGAAKGVTAIKRASDNVEFWSGPTYTTTDGNFFHYTYPNFWLPAGTYYTTDSATAWSYNTDGVNGGFTYVTGQAVSNIPATHDVSGGDKSGLLYNGPEWTSGKVGTALSFDGTNDYVLVGNVFNGVKSVEFWLKTSSSTQQILDLNGSAYVALVSNEITATGWTSPTIYVNGVAYATIVADTWQHVVIITQTAINASAVNLGKVASYCDGILDEVKFYSRALSQEEARYRYNGGGPVAHWKLDEGEGTTAYDSTDNNYDLTNSGANWILGKYGSALDFGYYDFDSVERSVADFQINDSAGTIEAWFKTGDSGALVSSADEYGGGDPENPQFYSLSFNIGGSGNLSISQTNNGGGDEVDGSTFVADNRWHHAVVTSDGESYKLYIDGKAESLRVVSGGNTGDWFDDTANRDNITIGGSHAVYSSAYGGSIDDVSIYNYVRTPEQIKLDYNAGQGTYFR